MNLTKHMKNGVGIFSIKPLAINSGVHDASIGDTRPSQEVWSTSLSLTEYREVWSVVLRVSDRFTSLKG